MTNINLPVDHVLTLPITVIDAETPGVPVPAQSGDTFSGVASDPTAIAIGWPAGGSVTATFTPLKLASVPPAPVGITLSDADGLVVSEFTITLTADTAPYAIVPNFAAATFTTQPAPTS